MDMTVADLRKLAVRVQCINVTQRKPAREAFTARLNALISRAPKIRFWH